uniref:Uncharacterized protein n=1 Tax=Leptobrachium leishanense TaxID=445787 RepID=A0A8C5MSJ1_9ANUR
MASADLRDELTCTICTDIYTDPVTLPCGHNYCQHCIKRTWDCQEDGESSCPECRRRYRTKPELKRNLTLCNLAESVKDSSEPLPKIVLISCDYCDSPAAKTCLHCEASLCDKHLKKHSKSPEHILVEPTTSLENRRCSNHKEILKFYCREDAACICVICRLDGEHRGHQVETLNEASEKKKETLRIILEKLILDREKTEKRVQSLQEFGREVQEKTTWVTEQVTALIMDIREQLEALEERVLSEISRQEEQVSLRVSDQIRQLEIKKEELSRKMGDIEELCNMMDPLTVLQGQESTIPHFSYAEVEATNNRVSHDKKIHEISDLDLDLISMTLHSGLAGIVTDLKGQMDLSGSPRMFLEVIQSSDMFPDIIILPEIREDEFTNSMILLGINKGSNITRIENDTSTICLDVHTAGNNVFVSDDLKDLYWSEINQSRLERPERFEVPQVLSSRSFSSGQHYWEVEVSDSGEWIVGMAYPSIARSGYQSWIGHNIKSWGLLRCSDNRYYVRHDMRAISLPHVPSSQRLGIYVDYGAGQLVFYELSEPKRQLHMIKTPFTEPLHAAFSVGRRGWVKIRSHDN